MFLKNLSLRHYRNYDLMEFNTDTNINIFIGPNAQGKTNLLESIFVLALTKSYRTHKDKELIRWNNERAFVHGEIEKKYGQCQLDLMISAMGKKAKINGLEQRKLSDFIGTLNVVMFAPEDLEIVKGSPGIRRRFLDMEIGQVQPSYLHHLVQYQKVLMQRNNLLKTINANASAPKNMAMLEIWDQQLIEHGAKIMARRQNFVKKLQTWAEKIHFGITNSTEQLKITYQTSFESEDLEDETVLMNQFMIKLSQVKDQEIRRGMTLAGPHRDDLAFSINGKEAYAFGSQGQQRTTALSLKLAEIELIHEEVGEYPLLLLDDVLSELDQSRQTKLIETFQKKVQIFITTTGIESVNIAKLDHVNIFEVSSGQVHAAGQR